MTITSFGFFTLIALGVLIYYIVPKSWQWAELLFLSIVFYCFAAAPYTIIYLVTSTAIAYVATMCMDRVRTKHHCLRLLEIFSVIAIVLNLLIWFVFKGQEFWMPVVQRFFNHHEVQLIAALGMGYYTFQVLGYIIDCYWENIKPQRNPIKLFLFVVYFPQLITGPISRYQQLETLYDKHKFEYQNIAFGAQRILWGLVKKIVLAERVGIIVSAITAAPETYKGFYSWIAVLAYPLQMYADFSGCMDIVIGVSELFGIKLTENFNNPFFARTSQEFWQRWHITLGVWAKDYVLYPFLKWGLIVKAGKQARKKFGKKAGKFLINLVGMFVVWLVMGIWHGGYRYIIGVSLWYWIMLMLGDLMSPILKKIILKLNIKTESWSWHFYQSGRTYLICAIGAAFFCVGVSDGILLLQDCWKVITLKDYANPWIFFDGSLLNLGVTYGDINVIFSCIMLLVIVAILREKYGYARIWVQKQCVLFRWSIWIILFAMVLILGKYGPGYNAADFIYQGF